VHDNLERLQAFKEAAFERNLHKYVAVFEKKALI
jgi:hypothetical protein